MCGGCCAGEDRQPPRLPGHGVGGGGDRLLLDHRAVRRQQVRHPRPEDRQLLQSFHVSQPTHVCRVAMMRFRQIVALFADVYIKSFHR